MANKRDIWTTLWHLAITAACVVNAALICIFIYYMARFIEGYIAFTYPR